MSLYFYLIAQNPAQKTIRSNPHYSISQPKPLLNSHNIIYICTRTGVFEFRKLRNPRKKVLKKHFDTGSDMDEGMAGFYIKSGGIRGGGGNGGTKCGRWNPTAEQVKVLTDLFRSGLRTPSTDQIQKISNQLSFYGKIESKNVFYWFQNHKARERQKRRKVSVGEKDGLLHPDDNINNSSAKHFHEINRVSGSERVIETLQLFPLNSIEEPDSEKLRLHANECKDNFGAFSYTFGAEMGRLPPLDLRLSFM